MEKQKKQDVGKHSVESEFVPYDIALALNKLGFDEPCVAVYYGNYDERDFENGIALEYRQSQYYAQKGWSKGLLAPLYQQAFRWFREEYKLFGEVCLTTKQEDCEVFEFFVLNINEPLFESDDYTVYEKAKLACLRKLIEIVNQNKDENN